MGKVNAIMCLCYHFGDVALVELMYLVFTPMPGELL